MGFLTPPTDNLYKFMMICGMAGLLAIVIFSYQYSESTSQRAIAFRLQKAAFVVDRKYVVAEIRRLEAKPNKTQREKSLLTRQKWNWQRREAQMAVRVTYYRKMDNFGKGFSDLMLKGVYYTGIFILFGWLLWYFRLQQHLDESARRDAKDEKEPFKEA